MDAQNAAESDPPKPGASPQQQEKQHHRPRQGSGSDPDQKSPLALTESSPSGDSKSKSKTADQSSSSSSTAARNDDASNADRDSDAETIVLPGKDGHSPSKIRKVRQEDKSESDGDAGSGKNNPSASAANNHADKTSTAGSRSVDGVKKRAPGSVDKDRQHRNKDGASSGLSSAPASPPHNSNNNNNGQHRQSQQPQQHQQHTYHRRRRSDAAAASFSDSDGSHHKASSSSSLRDKLKSGERLLPHKRKAPKAESDDEADHRKARRQRTTSASLDNGRTPKDGKSGSLKPSQHDSRNRSISPHQRLHRRSASTQLPSQHSSSIKKKRLPPPLLSTEYHSDDSSASGSPHPRHSKLRSLATPASSDFHASPVKMAPHKKHLDAHGQTFLARACARGEYDSVKRRLNDRPEDLNVADYAGNTPLQIAAINGCEDIVKLLIDAGCNLDCVNYDKETPLLDAVDNGHIGVVRLLLDAGVNPRKANVNGEEPIDRVTEDTENGEEIRSLLTAAKKRQGERRRTSEDRHSHPDNPDARDSHAPDSPRHSPAATVSGSTSRRSGTVRSTKTRNDLLYMPLDDKTLRQAAGRGDQETVARILQVKEGFDDPESMVAAARGGHDLVIELLLGLGSANADPAPVKTLPAEFATPILAAIGQENLKVVQLLLKQQNFDPTRRFKGETYYEIARRRQGTNWKDEEHMLKNAYDEYKRSHKDVSKPLKPSPGRREREREREEKRTKRDDAKEDPRPQKRNASSPTREAKKVSSLKVDSPKDKRRSESFTAQADENAQKRGPGRPKKDDKVSNASDREPSPTHKLPKPKRAESDATGLSSEGETVKPRRKLISKGELKGERDRKRGSMTSNTPGTKEPPSPNETRNDDAPDKPRLSEKYHDRTKALKRDDSRDRVSVSGDGTPKRLRTSVTPDRPNDIDKDVSEAPIKRRRLDSDGQEKRLQKRPVSEDGKPRKSSAQRDASSKPSVAVPRKTRDEDSKGNQDDRDGHRKDSRAAMSGEKLIRVKQEDEDTDMLDADQVNEHPESIDRKARDNEEEQTKKKELAEREEAKKEDERRKAKAEEKRKREQEEARLREEEEKKRKEQEERELQKKREEEEEARKRREEEEKRRLEEEEKQREEERRKREEEKRKREEEEERKRKEEEAQKQREEEERLHREQLEREAAEEARRQREEEERKERERRERAHREEMERKRAAREAEQKRLREEQERARLEKLPPLLRWLSTTPNPKTAAVADKFKFLHGARYDTIRPEANNTPEGREQWVLNTHVALLLGEKDLELSRYTAWDRIPASPLAKLSLWRTEWTRYSLVAEKLWDFGLQLDGYYGDEPPCNMSLSTKERLKEEAWDRFLKTDMFFIKLSDFMYTVPNIPHLRGIKLGVEYCELMENEGQAHAWGVSQKWKQDPDASRYHGFAPRFKYYINGSLAGEEMPTRHQTSKTPFPENKVPRRGLIRVYPDDPDYTRLCLEQGLQFLLKGTQTPSPLANGVHSSPTSQASPTLGRPITNGANGHVAHEPPKDEAPITNGELPNGVHGAPS